MKIDYDHFKGKLEAEKVVLEGELGKVGRKNPDNPSDWEATPEEGTTREADDNDAADNVEEYAENAAIVNTLETRYNAVKKALDKIKEGTYGICEVGGEEIELDRLEANPSATTCKEHME
jgi:RNA polymerase-binding transcription factor DksA